jgi:hypothetical protein
MKLKPTSEAAFETVIEAHLLGHGYQVLAAERRIRLLKERRSALIFAAVTGKIAISEPTA